ncbi:non-ribosomal peptide synthetase [Acaryochloris sp. IP29b_bin.148]|uniref:non-ribosomal peptide synthetase n=1 Tax=Acaryochloris sp. IP29b_bin.148 TaxID=2969218 RepID=UPI002612DA20|nr:non-ribosomal peptide synthetase [Acaryochloris sp. IP29b_bin.148]
MPNLFNPVQQSIFHGIDKSLLGSHTQQLVCHLHERLDLVLLQKSWQEVIERHPVFRTSSVADNSGHLNQIVSEQICKICIPIQQHRWSSVSTAEQEEKLAEFLLTDRNSANFDISQAPLMRLAFIERDADNLTIVWTFHDALLDRQSTVILLKEVFSLYESYLHNQRLDLPPLPLDEDNLSWLAAEPCSHVETFWREYLKDFSAPIQLPKISNSERVKSEITPCEDNSKLISEHKSSKNTQLSPSLSASLETLARAHKLTLATLIEGAWAILLSRYTGETDVVFGVVRDFRPPRAEAMGNWVGLFTNVLPIRTNILDTTELLPWLKDLQSQATAQAAYKHTSLAQIQSWSEMPRETSLFESTVTFDSVELCESLRVQGGQWEQRQFELLESDHSPITLHATGGATISLNIRFDCNQFTDETVQRMLGHLEVLLHGFVSQPNQLIATLPLLTKSEQQQLLVQWNETNCEYPQNKCIHQLFEEQVERTPNQVAVVFEQQQLTYQELNRRANQLAHHLRNLGVTTDVLTGICVERSLDMIVGLLGVLKAGGAYVPLDPAFPQERLAYMLSDSQMPVLVTQQDLVSLLPDHQAKVVCLDSDWEAIAQENTDNPSYEMTVQQLAYVIYTSGSTGKPKGVQLSHGSVTNFLTTMAIKPGLTDRDILLAITTISFDIAVLELYLPLILGAKVILASHEVAVDGIQLLKLLKDSQATVMQATPATWQLLLAAGWQDQVQLKVLCGGEALSPELASKLLSKASSVWNMYGPTEATVWATTYEVSAQQFLDSSQQSAISIGKPIGNVQTYILDKYLQPVPVGVRGELYIGGVCLARGYLNRPDLNSERFISNPFDQNPEARLYKTGDLACYLPDGNIKYIGRIDNQVKIRGFRIELGEIEAVLSQHASIRETVVIVREDTPGDKRLVAYSVSQQENLLGSELRTFLKNRLPMYMVPSAFVFLDAMPLTPNGKVNRRALPKPDISSIQLGTDFVPPSNPTEEVIANIWSDILGTEKIGIHDNFFELGGHSLLATRIISRLNQSFSTDLSLQHIFESPTIESIAAVLATVGQKTQKYQAISPREHRNTAPLSFSQENLYFFDQLEPNSSVYNMPEACHLQGELNVNALQKSLDAIVDHHEILRTNYISENGTPIQVVNPSQFAALPIIDLQKYAKENQDNHIQKLLEQESQRPFDLATDPMLRVCLLKLAPQEHILLVVMHHIASDGWSMGVFWRQLTQLYTAFSKGQQNPLTPSPIQYGDYASWQKKWLSEKALAQHLNYWKQKLADAKPVLELPTDRPRPAVLTYCGDSQAITISKSLTQSLKQLCRLEGVTLYIALLAAFKILLYRYSGQADIIVGSPIAGRNRAEVEELIGVFINSLVLRTDLSGSPSFKTLLEQVRSTTVDAYTHQDLPFEKLVEELNPERSLSYHSIFQVMFALQDTTEILQFPGLDWTPLELKDKTALPELTLSLEEKEGGMFGFWNYNTDLFDASTISRMSENFQTLLDSIVADPHQNIATLPLISSAEKTRLFKWSQYSVEERKQNVCYHQLFEHQVHQTPHATAVIHQDQQLTYKELDSKANQLAHHLRTFGIGPDQIVGICLERSLEMAIGFLGIFKAGGAYLPLDPQYPSERLAFMLEDSQAPIILTQKHLVATLPAHQAHVICLDEDWSDIAKHSESQPANQTTQDSLAYIIYTSGSTGKPKGVMIPHRGLVNHNLAMAKQFELGVEDRVLQFASISFDIAVEELFPTWLSGATVVLRPDNIISSIKAFLDFVAHKQITILNFPTAYWHELVNGMQQLKCDLPPAVRLVVVGGEKASNSVYAIWQELVGERCRWLNTYGPTETSVTATAYEPGIDLENDSHTTEIPIGRPIDNVQIYVLDQQLQSVPIGVPGELHIGGAGVARGYLNRPELSDERFISHPFSQDPNAKLYKTGDLVYYRPDGNMMFLGRGDDQVKIRGFRIELGEIESALEQHPNVKEAVILAREDQPGDKRLVAYIVVEQGQLRTAEIRRYLKEQLPVYMVPSAFVMLEVFPLTPNGKVNRRALPAPDLSHIEEDDSFVAPRNEIEQKLADIWVEVLQLEKVSIHGNFFDLGGSSLLAVRLFQRIEKIFKASLPLSALLQAPTIEQFATILSQTKESISWSSLVPINAKGTKPPLFCIHGGGFNVLIYHDLAKHLGPGYPVYGLQAQGLDGSTVTLSSYEEMAEDYIHHLQTVQPQGPYFLSGVSSGGKIALEMAQQLRNQGHEVALVAMFDTSGPDIEDKLLPPIPRFFSVVQYILNYTLPRFIKKRMQVGPKALVHDSIMEIRKILSTKGSTQVTDEAASLPFEEDISNDIKNLPQDMNKLESWVHRFHLWVLRRSQLAYAAPEVEVLGQGGTFSDVAEKLKASHYKAWMAYECKPYAGSITIFKAQEQLPGFYTDSKMGWGSIAQGEVEIYSVPGYHADLVKSPVLAEGVRDCIDKAMTKYSI